jgi:hypothetical protein
MKQLFIFFTFLSSLSASTQTKLIAHKSHSGKTKTLFSNPIGESNFGMAPERFVRNSKLDSVILISEKVAIMVTSEHCHSEGFDGRDKSRSNLWSAGKDTVYEHELFNSSKSVDEIRKSLKEDYFFANPIETVVFIGFDGNYPTPKTEPKEKIKAKEIKTDIQLDELEEEPRRKKDSIFSLFILSLLSMIFRSPF